MKKNLLIYLFLIGILIFSRDVKGYTENLDDQFSKSSDSLKSDNPLIRLEVLNETARSYISASPDSVLKYALKLKNLAIETDNEKYQINSYHLIGLAYEYKGIYKKALSNYYSMLEMAEKQNEKVNTSLAYTNLAIVMLTLEDYQKSLEFSLNALALYEELGDKRGVSTALNNLGNVYLKMSDYETSLSYYQQVQELRVDLKDNFSIGRVYHNIALVYLAMDDYERSKDYFDLALGIDELNDDLNVLTTIQFNYCILLIATEKYDEAEELNNRSITLLENMGLTPNLLNFYLQRSEILIRQHKPELAFGYIQKFGNSIILTDNLALKTEYYSALTSYYKEIKEFEQAFLYQEKYNDISDSLRLNQQANTIANLQISYEMEDQKQKMSLLLAEQKISKNRNTIIGLISAILLLTLLISIRSNAAKKKSIKKQKIIELELRNNEEKLRKFMDSASEIINIYNSDLDLIDINKAGLDSLGTGVTKENVLGKNITELVSNITYNGRLETYKRVLKTGNPVTLYDIYINGKSGEKFLDVRAFRVGENLGMIISDISESKLAQEKLLRSESKLLALFQAMDDTIFVFDKKGTYVDIAPTNLDKLYRSKELLLGQTLIDVFDEEKGQFFMSRLEECLAWHQTVPVEYSIPINNEIHWFDGRFSPMADDRVILVARDITARKRNVEIIKKSEERYRNLLETMQEGMVLLNKNNIIIYLNPKAEKIYGAKSSHVIGKSINEILLNISEERITKHDTMMRDGEFYKFRTEILNNKGDKVALSVSESPTFENGVFTGSFVLFNDITEQIKNENAILESEAFNRAVVDSSPLAISARDNRGRLINANSSWMKMWNKTEDDLLLDKRKRNDLQFDSRDEYLGDLKDEVLKVYKQGGDFFIPHLHIESIDKWISQHFYAIMTQEDEVDRVVIITEDITEETKASIQLQKSLEDKEALLKEVHHRVKNNLQIISSLLKMQSDSIEDPKTLAMFTNSLNRIRSLSLVHEKIYSSDRIEEVDFAGFITSLCNLISSSTAYMNKNIKVISDVKIIKLEVSKAIACGLILNELLSNAYRHGFSKEEKGEIKINFSLVEDGYKMVVENNGNPLPADFKYDKCDTLGMQLVDILLSQLKGEMEIDSSISTKFILKFKR